MSTNASSSLQASVVPVVTRDPRFAAGRSLVQRGMAGLGAVDIFATLLEEVRTKYGDASIESAPAYYEYGNALLRASAQGGPTDDNEQGEGKAGSIEEVRSVAAAAAEKRLQTVEEAKTVSSENAEDKGNEKPTNVSSASQNTSTKETNKKETGEAKVSKSDEGDDDDLSLALDMMENAYSILEDYRDQDKGGENSKQYDEWAKEQMPRILLGLGDTLSAMNRHADAADAYSRALELRQAILQAFDANDHTVVHLQAHRKVCEANVLIAEELLACPPGVDVVTTETQSLIVKADERVSYAQGYYDKARDALQETVVFMGTLAARNVDLGQEKEDVCFIATMVMGVGESLAAIEAEEAELAAASANGSAEPLKKRAKR